MADRGRVLIIDGDTSTVDELRGLLESEGYAVDTAAGREDALRVLANTEPNLVLMAVHLSGVDPFDLRAELRQRQPGLDVPVAFMTTADDAEARVRGLESGDDLITKPFESREVLARVERQVTVSKVRLALRESEAKFRSVMESAIDAIISGDAEGMIRSWNSAATALFGHTEAEVIGHPIDLIIPDRFRKSHQEGIDRVSSGGPSHAIGKTVELAAIRKDGSEFPVELSLATWFLDEARYYTGIIRDISERKQAEQKFRSVTESAIDAIISADQEGVIVSWNKAATRILGYAEAEVIGERLELIIPERFHEAHRGGIQRVTETGVGRVIGTTVELFARTKAGQEVPIELSLSTWTVRNDRYFTGIIRDIGDRKEAENALRRSEQELREKTLALRDKNDALESTLSQLNEVHDQLIVQEKMASLGKLSAGMAHELNNPASAAQRGAAQLQKAFSQLQDAQIQMGKQAFQPADLRRMAELLQRARDSARRPTGLSPVARNDQEAVLEHWLREQGFEAPWTVTPALVRMGYRQADLEALTEVFTDQQFQLLVEWLSRTHEIHSLVAEIGLGTSRIVEIVGALKTYTYMDQAPVQTVDVREGLDNTLIILHSKLKVGITVHREYAEDLPSIQAHGGELNQVWTNIIDNAIDAMSGQGSLIVRAQREDSWLVVEIEDDGPGIPEDLQTMVFDPFFTTKPPGEGTGLGLNISRNLIVKKHGGQIELASRPGRTCFTVRLPLDCLPQSELDRDGEDQK